MGSWSKSTFLYLIPQALEFWDSDDHPSFPLLYPLKRSKACIFLFPLQSIHPLNLLVKRFGAHCNPNFHCSTQFHANFLYTKKLVLWVCTFLEDEKNMPEHSHQKKTTNSSTTFLSACSISGTMQDILLQKSPELKMEG